jgi:hypothetical protein
LSTAVGGPPAPATTNAPKTHTKKVPDLRTFRHGLPTPLGMRRSAGERYEAMAADGDFRALNAAEEVAASTRWGAGYLHKWVPTFTSAAVRDLNSPLRRWMTQVAKVDRLGHR